MTAFWPVASLTLLLGAVSWPFIQAVLWGLSGGEYPGLSAIWVIQNLVRLTVFFFGLSTMFWQTTAALTRLIWLGRQPLRLLPLEEDGLLGLRPAGRMALIVATTYFGITSLLAFQLVLAPAIGAFSTTLILSLLFGVALFFVPLWGLHRKMLASKKARQVEVRSRLLRLAFAEKSELDQSPNADDQVSNRQLADFGKSLARAAEVLALEAAGRKLDSSATWPFDLVILRRLGALTVPIVIALLTELARELLGF
jgi:hypothetical protein